MGETHSPAVLRKIVSAGVRNTSFAEASRELQESAELTINTKTVERAARRVGAEHAQRREVATKEWRGLSFAERARCPSPLVPAVSVVQFDCGRMLIRERTARISTKARATSADVGSSRADPTGSAAADQEPPSAADEARATALTAAECCLSEALADAADAAQDDGTAAQDDGALAKSGDACRSRFWRDNKVGCLMTMDSKKHETDPCPEIPASFLEFARVTKLVREMGHGGARSGEAPADAESPEAEHADAAAETEPTGKSPAKGRRGAPTPRVKTIVASRATTAVFGPMLAAAAWARGFFSAPRKAFVADGAAMNWRLWALCFSHFVPILDFIHALQYVYAAAMAGRAVEEGWALYRRWIQLVWSSDVATVIGELGQRLEALGEPPAGASASDPRQVVATALGYLRTHESRMDYARYRRLGLPLVSSYVESAVKQVGRRVKGTEKFWSERGAEAMLQLRADYLSETPSLPKFWQHRQQAVTGTRCYCRAN